MRNILGILKIFFAPVFWGGMLSAAPLTNITPNGLGSSVMAPLGGIYNITGGTQAGNNLFHSFSTFNLGTGDTADFNVTSNVTNILARVTGGPSSIDGTITSTVGAGGPVSGANLFFINPAGVMFTANAQVNLGGSFVVSTANYVKFSDGSSFYGDLNHPIQDAGLSSAPVSAFGFMPGSTPQPISFTGSQITMQAGTGLHVIGGDITLDQGTTLLAPSGNLTLFSAGGTGEVPFSLASPGSGYATAPFSTFGNVTLQNQSKIAIDGAGGGKMVIRGGKLVVDDSSISSANSGPVAGGTISVQANQINLQNGGQIESVTTAAGDAGDINIEAQNLDIDGSAAPGQATGIFANTVGNQQGIGGNAGILSVTVANAINLTAGGVIEADTFSSGNAGEVLISAGTMTIDGTATPGELTGIDSSSEPSASGNAGLVRITVTNNLALSGSGEISSGTFSPGSAGDVSVQAGTLSITGPVNATVITGISSQSNYANSGSAGQVTVTVAGSLVLSGSAAVISSSSDSRADAGSVTVTADSLSIDDSISPNSPFDTGIISVTDAADQTSPAKAGTVTVHVTGALLLTGQGEITTDTDTAGNAGNVMVQAESLTIDGSATPASFTGISSDCEPGATGNAGDVNVEVAGLLQLSGEGRILSSTFSSGNAGQILVHAGSMTIDNSAGANSPYIAGILSDSLSSVPASLGKAGSVMVTVDGALILTGGGDIDTDTETAGNAGNVMVQAGSLTIDGSATPYNFTGISSNCDAGSTGNAGDVNVNVAGHLELTGEGRILSSTFSSGNAGQVMVHAGSMTIDDSAGPNDPYYTGILSESESGDLTSLGKAGSVTVNVDGALVMTGSGDIDTDTQTYGDAGNVLVTAGSLNIDGSATPQDFTGIASESDGVDASPAASGTVTVRVAGALSITGGGDIDTDTYTSGHAGDVNVQADSLRLDGTATPYYFTGISSDALNDNDAQATANTGNAGKVTVRVAGALSLAGTAEIDGTTDTAGNGGDVIVQAGSISINDSTVPGSFSGITAQATAAGNGGNITIKTGTITLSDEGVISTSSTFSNAGNIQVTAENLNLENNGSINTSAGQDGGSIDLKIGGTVYLLNSNIVSQANGGAGTTGGNITIDPQFVILDDSYISANDPGGTGGNISITTSDFLNNSSAITATGATAGTITITAPDLDLSGSLLPLPNVLVNDEDRLRESCARSVNHEFSSLIVVGRGGTESSPDELQPDFGMEPQVALDTPAKVSR